MKSRNPEILHLSSIQKNINLKLNSIKDKQKKNLLKNERNKIMKNDKNSNIKYALEDLERKRKRYYENLCRC